MTEDEAKSVSTLAKSDWTEIGLPPNEAALCAYADKLTRTPGACGHADVDALRAAGWDDTAIHDATQVISYFNYINRIADGLGVDLEPEMLQDK